MSMNEDDLIRDLAGLKHESVGDDLVARMLGDAALETARRAPPVPSGMLIARILRDARHVARARLWQDRVAWGGLVAAGIVGLAIGFVDPGGYLADTLLATPVEYIGGYDFQLAGIE